MHSGFAEPGVLRGDNPVLSHVAGSHLHSIAQAPSGCELNHGRKHPEVDKVSKRDHPVGQTVAFQHFTTLTTLMKVWHWHCTSRMLYKDQVSDHMDRRDLGCVVLKGTQMDGHLLPEFGLTHWKLKQTKIDYTFFLRYNYQVYHAQNNPPSAKLWFSNSSTRVSGGVRLGKCSTIGSHGHQMNCGSDVEAQTVRWSKICAAILRRSR